jgi:phospholipase C
MENRRDFIKKASLLTGALGLSSIMPPAIQRALAINPAAGTTYMDAEHVVFLMQENRSFDHMFGTLKGVRGFNDPRAVDLPNKYPVWLQSNAKGETYAPFRLDLKDSRATWMSSLPHSWTNQVDARNNGKHDGWLEAKKSGNKDYAELPLTMGYYNREDIPFYYALADAFTVCDHNFCSSLTGTSPNRCFFWTGKIKEEQTETSKAHLSNDDIDGSERINWSTFPERLSAHQVDWKIYQNELSASVGLKGEEEDWLGNFTDNSLEFFKQYHVRRHPEHLAFLKEQRKNLAAAFNNNPTAKLKAQLEEVDKELVYLESNPFEKLTASQQELHKRAFVTNRNDPDYHQLESISYLHNGTETTTKIPKGDVLHQFRADVDAGKLPTVSWLVAPCNFSDHPGAPWYGAWYLSEAIDILTKNPEVWKKTIFILTYDENDGYFDHVPPFVAPNPKDISTGLVSKSLNIDAEFVPKGQSDRESPVGLGFRVPMVVVSPWTRGGYVNSQVFDHTSSIQFLEHFLSKKTGQKILEDNITSWRRSLCGDLTSVFRPYNSQKIAFPDTIARDPFIKEIHQAKFAKLPDNFKKLDPVAIQQVLKDPKGSIDLPKQEKGIKPANHIPYEIYAHGGLDHAGKQFKISLTAGNLIFGKASSGVGFNVYAGKNNYSFTVNTGDTLEYNWPLKDFRNQQYEVKVYSVNGFFRHFKGDENDPLLLISLVYHKKNNNYDGNLTVKIKRPTAGKVLKLNLKDNAYGNTSREINFAAGELEKTLFLDLASSHSWYDFTLTSVQYPAFSQQFAGHVEHPQESFTDPLMGNYP